MTARRRRSTLGAALVALALCLFVVQPVRALLDTRDTDYVAFVAGAHLLQNGECLYCLDSNRAERARLLGVPVNAGTDNPFVTPPASAALFVPLAALPLQTGLVLYLLLCLLCTAAAGWLLWSRYLRGRPDAALILAAALGTLTATEALANAQWVPLILLAVTASLVLGERRPWLAGFVLAFALVKPQLIWLVVPSLAIGRHWRVVGGFVAGGLVWGVASAILAGPHSLIDWIQAAAARRSVATVQNGGVPGLATILGVPASIGIVIMAVLGAGALVLLWRRRALLTGRPDVAIAVAAGMSLATVAYVWPYDLALLAPLIVLAALRRVDIALWSALLLTGAEALDLAVPATADHAVPVALLSVVAIAVMALAEPGPRGRRPAEANAAG